MRAIFIGASTLTIMTVQALLKRGHEAVIIEREKDKIDALSDVIACGFIHGDGSKPVTLKEADPEKTDLLYCLTNNDQTNLLASLVGRSLGFGRVFTRIDDMEFEHLCIELGLEDLINPAGTIARHLADVFEGQDPFEVSGMVRDEARAFSFLAREEDTGPVSELELPEMSRVACIYRNDKFVPVQEQTKIRLGDEVIILTHRQNIPELMARSVTSAV